MANKNPLSQDMDAPPPGMKVVSNTSTDLLDEDDSAIEFVKDKGEALGIPQMTPPFDPAWPDDD